jgi:hypothetical protein
MSSEFMACRRLTSQLAVVNGLYELLPTGKGRPSLWPFESSLALLLQQQNRKQFDMICKYQGMEPNTHQFPVRECRTQTDLGFGSAPCTGGSFVSHRSV